MDGNRQTKLLMGNADVVLNIGLGAAQQGPWRLGVTQRLRVFTKVLPLILQPGYIAHLNLVPQRVWVGEPLLVVQGTFHNQVACHDALWNAVTAAEQDCIAIYYPKWGNGQLFGPKAEAWGEFNINFFSFLGD